MNEHYDFAIWITLLRGAGFGSHLIDSLMAGKCNLYR